MKFLSRAFALPLVLPCLAAALIAGCGKEPGYVGAPRAEVTGKVTLDGKPVATGSIMLVNTAGGTGTEGDVNNASGGIENGVYKIEEANGPTAGTYRVEIYAYELPPEIASRTDLGDDERGRHTKQVIPRKYNQNSSLSLQVTPPKVEKDFELTSK